VTALVFCGDAVVVGRRLETVTQDPGAWEVVPSGGVEPECLRPDGFVDPIVQLRKEMCEEIGLDAAASSAPRLLWRMIEGEVNDLVFGVEVSCDRGALSERFARRLRPEHSALELLEIDDLERELMHGSRCWAPSSRALLTVLAAGRHCRASEGTGR